MTPNRFDVLERFEPLFEAPEPTFERFLRRRDRRRRKERVAAGAVGIGIVAAIVAGMVWVDANRGSVGDDRRVGTSPTKVSFVVPKVDSIVDLVSGRSTPLPAAILRSSDEHGHYAVSPDGSRLAYVGTASDGSPQIFIARLDGGGVQQLTHDPRAARSPAWSTDGSLIAYEGYGDADVSNIFIVEVSTGRSRRVTDETEDIGRDPRQPQFTPDGSSLLYTGGTFLAHELRTIPIGGGRSTLMLGPDGRLCALGGGSSSPDGSRIVFSGGEVPTCSGASMFLADADGTDRRPLPCGSQSDAVRDATSGGVWSPDGTRIVCSGPGFWSSIHGNVQASIRVIDVATGAVTPVAGGLAATWLNDHALIVES